MKIGVKYSYNENWIGGTYYIENLIKALDRSNQVNNLELVVFSDEASFERVKKLVRYADIKKGDLFPKYNLAERLINKLGRFILGKNIIKRDTPVDLIFPLNGTDKYFKNVRRKIYWIPDFQDKFLKSFFSESELKTRSESYDYISKNAEELVFSSVSALKDFNMLYPKSNAKTYVLKFAVSHDFGNLPGIKDVLERYDLSSDYFMSPNQFWQHKNHAIILRAAAILKAEKIKFQIIFTGKEYDYRNPDYTDQIKNLAKDLDIEEMVKFLGFIDRNDQIALMKNAQAIIQPSFFEGWSTVIEDAKALNQIIIASDIAVHREQLGNEGNYFDPNNASSLADHLRSRLEGKELNVYKTNYDSLILNFANEFLSIATLRK